MPQDVITQPPTSRTPTAGPHDPYEDYELPVEGFKGTPEEIERQWYEKCYPDAGTPLGSSPGAPSSWAGSWEEFSP
jgi:hypothetical protein